MAIFAISDLHLAKGIDKPMDVFGKKWENYMEKLEEGWQSIVAPEDTVIIPGDISWATYLEESIKDFIFIEKLPGKKIISKGNHDYWWTTASKMEKFLQENNLKTISFMHNNSFQVENAVVCGTRGWKCPGDSDFTQQDEKIYNREIQRFELSIKSAEKNSNKIAALHYPPFNSSREASGFIEIMKHYGIKLCIYGHLHGNSLRWAVDGLYDGILFKVVSADFVDFIPVRLM